MLLHLLLGILVVVAIALTIIILFQRSEGGALGMGGGGGGQFMSARGASDLLTRTTQVLAGIFFVLSLTITILSGRQSGTSSVADRVTVDRLDPSTLNQPAPGAITAPAPTIGSAPATGSVPTTGQTLDLGAPAPTAPLPGFQTAPATAPNP